MMLEVDVRSGRWGLSEEMVGNVGLKAEMG